MDGYEKKKYKPVVKKPQVEPMNPVPGPKMYTIVYQDLDFVPEK